MYHKHHLKYTCAFTAGACNEPEEHWNDCGDVCEPKCDVANDVCVLYCGQPACTCSPGYVRHSNGHCLPKHDCPNHKPG